MKDNSFKSAIEFMNRLKSEAYGTMMSARVPLFNSAQSSGTQSDIVPVSGDQLGMIQPNGTEQTGKQPGMTQPSMSPSNDTQSKRLLPNMIQPASNSTSDAYIKSKTDNPGLLDLEMTPMKLKEAIILSEIIGKPMCKRRRSRYGYQSNHC